MKRHALPILFIGAVGIGFGPILVRLSEVGPVATAFYRLLFALPVLWGWFWLENRASSRSRKRKSGPRRTTGGGWAWISIAGICFAADLALWHTSIHLTTVANATLLTNFSPVFVALAAGLLFRETIGWRFVAGMVIAMAGAAVLIGASLEVSPQQVLGDGLALASAVFYAGYLLAIKQARARFSTSDTMFRSGLITCLALLAFAWITEDRLLAVSPQGWGMLIALALVAHLFGQVLIAFSLAHLPASFASVGLLLQPIAAAGFAWLLLRETIGWIQGLGALIVLAGIYLAWRASNRNRAVLA